MNIVERARQIFLSNTKSQSPSASDSGPVAEARAACEGADCLFYDFGHQRSDVGAMPVAHDGCSDTCATPIDGDDICRRSKGFIR